MKLLLLFSLLVSALSAGIRPPAAPLITVDPFFSVWSQADELTSVPTTHWTGTDQPIVGAVRIDGKTWRVLGKSEDKIDRFLPGAAYGPWIVRYVLDEAPVGDWTAPFYDDTAWTEGKGAIGSGGMPNVHTEWAGNDRDVWLRRHFTLDRIPDGRIVLEYSHDDVFELYVNGVQVVSTGLRWRNNVTLILPEEALKTLHEGDNVIAAHCHNTTGGSYVDFSLYSRLEPDEFGDVARQTSCTVLPTRTVYTFECGGCEVELTFLAPMLPDDLDLMARPVNYLTYAVRSLDGKSHKVQLYTEATPRIAMNQDVIPMISRCGSVDGVDYVCTGSVAQKVLGRKGDRVRADWGYFYLGAPAGNGTVSLAPYADAHKAFAAKGEAAKGESRILTADFVESPVALSYVRDLGKVGAKPVSDMVLLAYDDIYSLQFFGRNLRGYWNRDGNNTITREMRVAADAYEQVSQKAALFDERMMQEAGAVGGEKYADLCALAYRQCLAAHKLVVAQNGELMLVSKENSSNGSAGTVDVTYPSAPLFLYYNTELAKALMNHIYFYVEHKDWPKPFAPHDVGGYPLANGQTYGGDMPLEESADMIILTAAVSALDGDASYARKHWKTLSGWADYLSENGQDPTNQLCTDDFAGHYAHNTNLSVKSILGVASYAKMAGMLGMHEVEGKYIQRAREMALIWQREAFDGDHYRLTFDRPGTWSQKYNLVWDSMLGLNVFDPHIASTEVAFYLTRQNRYGLPLDGRRTYTKTDWVLWTACLAPDLETFRAFVDPIWDFMNETVDRVPMSDLIYTDKPQKQGFFARSVVGGYWMRLLENKLTR